MLAKVVAVLGYRGFLDVFGCEQNCGGGVDDGQAESFCKAFVVKYGCEGVFSNAVGLELKKDACGHS
jgi:hypothetical protein